MKGSVAVWVLFISSIGWGLTWVPIKLLANQGFAGLELVLYAFTAATLVLLPLLLWQHRRWRGHALALFLIMLLGGMANVSFQLAMVHGDVIRVMILFYLLPVWSVIGARLFLKEHIDRLRVLSVIMAIAGAMLILNGPGQLNIAFSGIDLLALTAGLTFALNNLVFRATPRLPIASKVAAMFIGVVVLIVVYLLLQVEPVQFNDNISLFYPALYGIAWLTLITFATQWGVTQIEAGRAAVIIVMELVAAVVSAALWYQQILNWQELLGIIMVVTAAITEGSREEKQDYI